MDTRLIKEFEEMQLKELKKDIPEFGPGDLVRVHVRLPEEGEKGRTRIQPFDGIVIRRKGGGLTETFTVRKISHGVGVERTFYLHSPFIEKIEVIKRAREKGQRKPFRQARIYYIRERMTKSGKVR